MVVSTFKLHLNRAKLDYTISEINNVDEFIKFKLTSVPAIKVNDDTVFTIKSNGIFNKSLRTIIRRTLAKANFGAMSKILIPIDFSNNATNAFYYGHRLASEYEAVIKVLYSSIPQATDISEAVIMEKESETSKQKELDDFVFNADMDWGGDLLKTALVEKRFKIGFPAETILNEIKESIPDFIIMASNSNTRAQNYIGSVTSAIISHSTCSVLVVPPEGRYTGIKHILFAIDKVNLDIKCSFQLIQFAIKFNATIHLIHVLKPRQDDTSYELIEVIKQRYPKSKLILKTINSMHIVLSLNEYAITNDIDMIAMSKEKEEPTKKFLSKSITKDMIRQSKIPVFVIKET